MITGRTTTLTSDGGWSLDLSEQVLARPCSHVYGTRIVHRRTADGQIPDDGDLSIQ